MSEWISVKDRLPTDTRNKIVCVWAPDYDDEPMAAWYAPNGLCWFIPGLPEERLELVTHWQPMPSPPTEGGKTE